MDAQYLDKLIENMIQPGTSVSSLTACAKAAGKSSREDLHKFLTALCQMDIYKAALVACRLSNQTLRQWATEIVRDILSDRCRENDTFSPLELLAIATFSDTGLLSTAAPFFTQSLIQKAFQIADATTACNLLHIGLLCLSEEPYGLIREAFFAFCRENSRMGNALSQLLPVLVEKNASQELSILLETVGPEQIQELYGNDLFPTAKCLILDNKGTLPLWKVYLTGIFTHPCTPEELERDCLLIIRQYEDAPFFRKLCSLFYLSVAITYGPDHPAFDHVIPFAPPGQFSRDAAQYYSAAIEPLWAQPSALSHFLDRTAPCNPYRTVHVQGRHYTTFNSRHDPVAYERLAGLFAAQLPAATIVKIFFSTQLRQNLPLEDLFLLAKDCGVLPALLQVLQDVTFLGAVAQHRTQRLVISSCSYFTTHLHITGLPYHLLAEADADRPLKGMFLSFYITDFDGKHIKVTLRPQSLHGDAPAENRLSWEEAVAELEEALQLPELSRNHIKDLAITSLSLDNTGTEQDFHILSQLLLDAPSHLPAFLNILKNCKWNAPFLKSDLKTPGHLYRALEPYQESAKHLFAALLASDQDPAMILELYFSSVYKTILPFNELLLMTDRDLLLELLSSHMICCRFLEGHAPLCRLQNIKCAPICSADQADTTATESFYAVVANIIIRDGSVCHIALQPCPPDVKDEQDFLFNYISANAHLNYAKASRFAKLPGVATWDAATLKRNLPRMENAIHLRRSDSASLIALLQDVGQANPLSFQQNHLADQIYLRDLRVHSQIPTAAISMVLNAANIRQLRDFYLHTSVKYHLTLPDLAALISQRRPNLLPQLPTMFDDTVFFAITDAAGGVWTPWVKQGTLRVSPEYAGQFLHCRFSLQPDGEIQITVLEAFRSDAFNSLLNTCLLTGYHKNSDMATLVYKPTVSNASWQIDYTLSLGEIARQLQEKLAEPQLRHDLFADELTVLISTCCKRFSHQDMINTICDLVIQWVQRYPRSSIFRNYLFNTHKVFIRHYQSVGLGVALCQVAYRCQDEKTAAAFEKGVRNSIRATTGREMSPGMNVWIAPPKPIESEDREPAKALFETYLLQCRELSENPQIPEDQFIHHLGKMIRTCHNLVSPEEMEGAILAILAPWLPRHKSSSHLPNHLRGLFVSFAAKYQTNSLGNALCELARTHLPEDRAQILEQRIFQSKEYLQLATATTEEAPDAAERT